MSEEPILQKQIADLVDAGVIVDLIIEHADIGGENAYYLYCKIKNRIRPIFTQRQEHRYFSDLDRAAFWAKRVGFRNFNLNPIILENVVSPDD